MEEKKGGLMAGNTYSLLLQAQINAASIQEQLTAMAGKYTLAINAAISSVQQVATTAVAGGATGAVAGVTGAISPAAIAATTQFREALQTLNPVATVTNNLTGQMMKATDAQAVGLDEVAKRTIALSKNQETFTDTTRTASIATKSWVGDLMNAYEKIMLWAVATGTVYGAIRALKEGVEYIKDLNKEMTNIQIVTGYADNQIKDLALSYNRLAQSLSVSTLEISRGTLEWFRQGKSIEEANTLVTQSIIMSKLANMSSAEATTYLTATLNGFKMEAKDASIVLDKLVGIDNSFATSVGGQTLAETYSNVWIKQLDTNNNLCYNV